MVKGDWVRVYGDSAMHGEKGEVVEVLDGFARVRFVRWSGPYTVLIWTGYLRVEPQYLW